MSAIVIQNFSNGLDTRRSVLTSVLGTLVTLENAAVNQGGEIEKRKTFLKVDMGLGKPAAVTILGVQPVQDSIVILGRGNDAGVDAWLTSLGSNPAFTYQELKRPDSSEGAGELEVASVTHSTTRGGRVFAICRLIGGAPCAFYDGVLVTDSLVGVVEPAGDLYGYLKDQINDSEGYTATVITDGLEITGLPGKSFSLTSDIETTNTLVATPSFISDPIAPVEGRKASGYFSIEDGVYRDTAQQITSVAIRIFDATGNTVSTTELLNGGTAISYTIDPETTAALVVASINTNKTTSGYNAKNTGNVVILYANAVGITANSAQIRVTTTGRLMIGKCAITFAGTGFVLDYIKADGVSLLAGGFAGTFPTAAETLTAFVNRVATEINNNTTAGLTHGYVAMYRNATLKISKKVTLSFPDPVAGTDAFPRESKVIQVDAGITPGGTDTGVITDGDATGLIVIIEPTPIALTYRYDPIVRQLKWTTPNVPIRAMAVGGRPPYTYSWSIINVANFQTGVFYRAGGGRGSDATGEITYLGDYYPSDPAKKQASIQLHVKDSTGVEVIKTAQVAFNTTR